MSTTLDALELSPDEADIARERIRGLAYEKWREAGCPEDQSLFFWLVAEREWIEHEYVPHREDLAPKASESRRSAK